MGDFGGNSYSNGPVVDEERSWAMAAHLGVLAGSVVPFGNILAPLVIWLIQKNKSPFVAKHALESLMFQVGMLIALIVLCALAIVTMGVGMIVAMPGILLLFLAGFVYMILATMRANDGLIWEYPVTTRFVQ